MLTLEQKREANQKSLPIITNDNCYKDNSCHWALKLWSQENLKDDIYAGFKAGIAYMVFAEMDGRRKKHPEMTNVCCADERFADIVTKLLRGSPENFREKYMELLGIEKDSAEGETLDRHDIINDNTK